MADLDIVGGAAVDVVPIVPNFHNRLRAMVLPIADRVGREAGERMGDAIANSIRVAIPQAVQQGGQAASRAAGRQGDDTGGAFARSLRRRLEVAFRAMPRLDVRLSDTGVDAQLARIRARLEQLSSRRIGIDVSTEAAAAEIRRLDAELQRLGASHADVSVRADTATARAALAEIAAEIRAVDATDPTINVDVDTAAARSALFSLSAQVLAIAAIPVGPALAAGLGAVVTMATAAGGALGAFGLASVPAIKGVSEALKTQKAAQEDSTRATTSGANAGVQAAQRALQVASAQDSLAAAHRNGARSIAAANRQVEDAERAAAQASQRAADQRRQAAEAVERAEESLADAQRAAQRAEQDLTDARAEAARQLRDLNDRLTEGALDEREAALRVRRAEEELQAVRAKGAKATQLERDEAQLRYDQAVQSAAQQKRDYADLQAEAKKQADAGVEGNEAVRSATERVGDAQRAVRDQTKALADAQRASARAQADAAQSVADAQRRVADAVENVAAAQTAAAEAIESAERGVASARLNASKSTETATTKAQEHEAALRKLSPTQRALYDSIAGPQGLKAAYDEWQKSLQPHTLPIFTRAVDAAKASLPGLSDLVIAASRGIQTLMDKASTELKSPFWDRFKAGVRDGAEPAIVGLGVAIGNVFKGAAGIVDAFLPHLDGIVSRSDSITERFAEWGTSLRGSPDFERFLAYVKDTAPGLGAFLGDLLTAAVDVGQALAPLSQIMFAVLTPVIEGLSWLATNAPGVIQVIWGLYFAQKAIALGMFAYEAAMGIYALVTGGAATATWAWASALWATGIVPLIIAIVAAVAALAAGIVWAYKNVGWFRDAVDVAWNGIKAASLFLWDYVLKPVFAALWWAIKGLGDIAVWLWEKAIAPAFKFIWEAGRFMWTVLWTILLLPLYLAFRMVGEIGLWLWDKALGPAFRAIGDLAMWLWDVAIKPAFREIQAKFSLLGSVARQVWEQWIRPAFQEIGDKAKWLYEKGVKPQIDNLRSLLDMLGDAFHSQKDNIKRAWDQISGIAKAPVEFIAKIVYNKGIVPVWNAVAKITGVGTLDEFKGFHTGGIMSGYSPGRDDRLIAVGGGEAIMRPEWTRAVGADRINSWNAAARSGGVGGVQRAISAGTPAFKDGGVVDWIKGGASKVGDVLKGGWDALTDPAALFDELTGGVRDKLKSLAQNPFAQAVGKMPMKMLAGLKAKALEWFSFSGGGGAWGMPVDAKMGTPFGQAGGMWSSGRHTGLDFPAAVGTLVRAVAGGKVSMATGGGPYGNHVMINHGGGIQSLYAHLSEIVTKVGDTVRQGQNIGRVGATGNVTGPHLHLEARVNGRPVDPMTYLAASGGGDGGSGVARWRPAVLRALSMVGQPESMANTTLRRMMQESGGDPRAVNLWDVNARNGTPSTGLMQVIRPTFEAYAGAMRRVGPFLHGVSVDPIANIYSSMRYALSRYGSLPRAYDRPGGYASGGLPGIGELAWVGEHGPELVRFLSPTQVYSATDSASLARQMSTMTGGGQTGPTQLYADVHVYVGDREITDIVDVRITQREARAADQLYTGRRF
ncbi:peptidoglycan DD-metalloendopeptidase family protein [Streptomyces sp. NPDC048603]|uniref:peptidoglycan DD-metalloendopeptidase family protein n=1 Tax=Streptomyces sp. NPDC048603 TaxID=3365577 RepID=UPI00371C6E3F